MDYLIPKNPIQEHQLNTSTTGTLHTGYVSPTRPKLSQGNILPSKNGRHFKRPAPFCLPLDWSFWAWHIGPLGSQDLTAQFCVREIFMESLVKSGWLIRIRISWFIMIPIKLGSINPLCNLNNQVFFSLLMWICCEDLASDWTTWQLKLPFLDGERSQLFCGKLWLTDFFGPWLET